MALSLACGGAAGLIATLVAFTLIEFPAPATATPPGSAPVTGSTATTGSADAASVGWSISLVLVLTLLNALFSMAETALVSIRRSRVEQLVEEGRRGARSVRRLTDDPPRFIATTQVGITLLGFASAAAAATTLARPLVGPLLATGFLDEPAAGTLAVVLVTILIALVSMVLGEIAPKSLAVQAPDRWALLLAPFINFCATLFAPLTWLVIKVSGVIVKPFGAKAQFETPVVTKEELEHIVSESEENNELDEDERKMLHNVFDLTETPVRKVMTPRRDMTSVAVDAGLPSLLDTIIASGHSRLPVYENSVDKVVGIVHAKDLLPLLGSDELRLDLRRVMRAAKVVPESKSVMELLSEFRRSNQQVAIVKDEYDQTQGIVTIEDLVEEIVGPIRDEYDVDEPQIIEVSPVEFNIDGRIGIGDVNDHLGIELPEGGDEYDSISGFVSSRLGRAPLPGDRVRHESMEFVVEQVEGMLIRTLRAVKLATADEEAEGANGSDNGAAAGTPAALAAPARAANGAAAALMNGTVAPPADAPEAPAATSSNARR